MDRETKIALGVFALVASGFAGVSVMTTKEQGTSMIGWAVALLILAVAFWLWVRWEDRARQSAEEAAQRALAAAEKAARDAEARAQQAAAHTSGQIEALMEQVEAAAPVAEMAPMPEPPAPAPPAAAPAAAEPVPAVAPAEPVPAAPEVVAAPGADDLTRIEGIGPKYRDVLAAAEIKTFAQLAAVDEARLIDLIRAAGMRKPGSVGTWAEQARLAAAGDWDALAAFQQSLAGGRRSDA